MQKQKSTTQDKKMESGKRTQRRIVRKNGWQSPISRQQILAITCVYGNAGLYYGLVWPFRPADTYLLYLVPYTVLVGIAIPLFWWIETVDPMRPDNHEEKSGPNTPRRLCQYCDNQKPMKLTTKHCHICNKCVSHFDHHCLWLNTCIGAYNYWQFFSMLCCIVTMQLLHISLICVNYADGGLKERADRLFGRYEAYLAISATTTISPIAVLGLVGTLLGFHIYIKYRGTTTYLFLKGKTVHEAELNASRKSKAHEQEIEKRRQFERKQWLEDRERRKSQQRKSLKKERDIEGGSIILSKFEGKTPRLSLNGVDTRVQSNAATVIDNNTLADSTSVPAHLPMSEMIAMAIGNNIAGASNTNTVSEGKISSIRSFRQQSNSPPISNANLGNINGHSRQPPSAEISN